MTTDSELRIIKDEIVQSVKDRGYLEGWTGKELLGRQIAKMQEELAELADLVLVGPSQLWSDIRLAGETARMAFDDMDKAHWNQITGVVVKGHSGAIKKEISDMQVVMVIIEHAVYKCCGSEFNAFYGALGKAEDDVERGKRQ